MYRIVLAIVLMALVTLAAVGLGARLNVADDYPRLLNGDFGCSIGSGGG
jgi:hypothetical protein